MLALDLGVLNRGARVISLKRALGWSVFCVLLALAFSGVVYGLYHYRWGGLNSGPAPLSGETALLQFLTCWLVEQALSLDNVFVIALIFAYFRVPREYQHRALFWGIVGALLMRAAMIVAGAALIARFDWIVYVFGGLLVVSALKMLWLHDEHLEPDRNPLVRLARCFFPVSPRFDGERFFTRVDGRLAMTPLFVALIVIESSDVIFAVDSIPAVFGFTRDPFIVFTSNVFAILNLRTLYFALSGLLAHFRYLKHSLVVVLLFVGVKMLLEHHVHIRIDLSLAFIAVVLAAGMIASRLAAPRPVRQS
ncbi:MAG: TerC family protein [Phycisphaerae bacterium]|nr:TerC family protein [Phycisphaerae bacterium]